MIEIRTGESEQYINFSTRFKRTVTHYSIRSATPDPDSLDLSAKVTELPIISIPAEFSAACAPEFRLSHRLYQRPLESHKEYSIDPPPEGSYILPCSVLRLEIVEQVLKSREGAEFYFDLIIDEQIDIDELLEAKTFRIEVSSGERSEEEVVAILNRITTNLGPIPITDYFQVIGDLRTEVVWEPEVAGIPSDNWYIEIDELGPYFTPQGYRELIEQALALTGTSVLERIPRRLKDEFRSMSDGPLTVKVIITEIPYDVPLTIRYRRHPEREIFFPTNIEPIDQVLRRVHLELLQLGMPVGPAAAQYQRVLSYLLKYRSQLLTLNPKVRFADPDVLRENERSFHNHLYLRLNTDLEFGDPNIIYEHEAGNSRIDLLISSIPTELKLERRNNLTTQQIIDTYKQQAADYASRCESPIGILAVLDAVPERGEPSPPAEQDVVVVAVPTASGGPMAVVGIVMRLPRAPSGFSKK